MDSTDDVRAQCGRALALYLAEPGERTRHAGYLAGRRALEAGLPLLDLVAVLHAGHACGIHAAAGQLEAARISTHAGEFVAECLSPYEMALRAARDAIDALRRQNELLEEEARRIAHEVHDSAAQLLVSVYTELDRVTRESAPDTRAGLERVRLLLNGVEADVRRLAHELRPTMLDDLGLVPALRTLAEGVSLRAGVQLHVSGASEPRLPAAVETVLYRVAQEALSNVARHARARRASVLVEQRDGSVHCTIADDGVGFPPAGGDGSAPRGMGLIGIRERLAGLGGVMRCENGMGGRGARLIVTVPLEVKHASHSGC